MLPMRLPTNETAYSMDCIEYFDYLVPSVILQKFFELNPVKATSHQFCDLHLQQLFQDFCPIQPGDIMIPDMWHLEHYRVPQNGKLLAFEQDGERDSGRLLHSVDQASFPKLIQTDADRMLSEKYPNLSPGQVAIIRSHLESLIITVIELLDERMLEKLRSKKIAKINKSHGPGFGEDLWEEAYSDILALFDSETFEATSEAWRKFAQGEEY
jgi:hypothetical protein